MNKKILYLLSALILYLLSSGISFAVFSYVNSGTITSREDLPGDGIGQTQAKLSRFKIDPSLPKTEICPLNGELRAKIEKEKWEKRRPLFVMIENHKEARPQSGLSNADVIYEAVAEGGITRFGAVFYCAAAATEVQVGPVRSARTYFVDYASEYGDYPLYVHVGGAHCDTTTGTGCLNGAPADTLGQIERYGWGGYNDINQFSVGFPTFWRDYERIGSGEIATEHTMYSTSEKLWKVAAEKRELTDVNKNGDKWDENFVSWKFKEEAKLTERPLSASVEFPFWTGYSDYVVKWEYDRIMNSYKRYNGGVLQVDRNDETPIAAKNVVLLYTTERHADDGYDNNAHMLYGTIGKGNAQILMDGKVIEANWQKQKRTSRTIFTDKSGKEIAFNGGQIWIEILAIGTEATVR